MNRRQLMPGKRVAYVQSKYRTPVRAVIKRVDRSDGYGAQHTVTLVDENWRPINDAQGNPQTKFVTSRQIKDWDEVEEGVEEKRFLQEKKRIEQQLKVEADERAQEPWDQLVKLLNLQGCPETTFGMGYMRRTWTLTIPEADAEAFVGLLVPMLTERLFSRTGLGSTEVEPSA